jgi:alpha-glucosidase
MDPSAAAASPDTADTAALADADWWRHAVIYQIYIRSFADGDGDGMGDIAGIRSKIGYLSDLGIDAVWINPWYPSPQADAGYDVADYRAIEAMFGDLDQAQALIDELHAAGIRVILDIVPNHSSDQHAWFQRAAADPEAPEREYYVFRSPRPDGSRPNNWHAMFGGPAWDRVPAEVDDPEADYYLHLFAPEQPDLNWESQVVRDDFEQTLRFWFDRGVDGFRIDVAHALIKDQAFPDLPPGSGRLAGETEEEPSPLDASHQAEEAEGSHDDAPAAAMQEMTGHPFWDQDRVHDIYRSWRRVADSYADTPQGKRIFVSEAWVPDPQRLANYVRSDELNTTFNFDFLRCPWEAAEFKRTIDEQIAMHALVGAPVTWVVSNHDVTRHLTRYGWPAGTSPFDESAPVDLDLGRARARAVALFMFALPGGSYVYMGEELGLWEVDDLPVEALQDPVWERSGRTRRGRDGCRVPLPWTGTAAPFGFGTDPTAPWLPQPPQFADFTAEKEAGDPKSMLSLYREALRIRRGRGDLGDGPLTWTDATDGDVLAFARSDEFTCVVNTGATPAALPPHREVILASADVSAGSLPPNSSAWLLT